MNLNIIDNDLLSIQEARILAENAQEAQAVMASFSQKKLDTIVEATAAAAAVHAEELAKMSVEETDYGRWEDKFIKNRFASEYLTANLRGMKCVGIVDVDEEKKLACETCVKAGADYVKTSTGFGTGGATAADVALMKASIPASMKVKAAGGMHSWQEALAMVEAGASRLGTSSTLKILEGAEE